MSCDAFAAAGRDRTDRCRRCRRTGQRALAVVAHPDDLEYGAASAMARWTDQGKWVGYVLATSGEAGIDGMDPGEAGPLRRDEERAGAAHVGVDTVEFLDHRDGVIEGGLGAAP